MNPSARTFELHCTLGDKGISSLPEKTALFRKLCSEAGIKTIVYENGYPRVDSTHVMTSTEHKNADECSSTMAMICAIANKAGVTIQRRKIETSVRPDDVVTGKDYFECHVPVRGWKNGDESRWTISADRNVWSISRNTEKEDGIFMITMRGRRTTVKKFRAKLKEEMSKIQVANYLVNAEKPVYVERCIFDDATEIDAGWMGKNL